MKTKMKTKKLLRASIAIMLLVVLFIGVLPNALADSDRFMNVYVSGDDVRERTEPSTNGKIVAKHYRGEIVQVIGVDGDWAQLSNGNWMSKKYLTTDATKVFYDLPMYVIGTGVRERTSMNTNSTSNIAKTHGAGDVVRVQARLDNGWYLLMNGNYIRQDMLTVNIWDVVNNFTAKYDDIVIVSVRHQYVRYYQNGRTIGEGKCVTGCVRNGTETPSGLYTITSRNDHFCMNGKKENYVNYAMYFNGGIALHDADHWRSSYGGSTYIKHGSHGCVNLPLALAELIWNNYSLKHTRVLVIGWVN